MISILPFSTAILISTMIGLISAYFAHRRGKNPLIWFFVGLCFGLLGLFFFFFTSTPKKRKEPIKVLVPKLIGPVHKFWYYAENNAPIGPLSYQAIDAAWKEKKIHEKTLVWHEELPEWTELEKLTVR